MIRMMMSIIPTDMAPSPKRTAAGSYIRRAAVRSRAYRNCRFQRRNQTPLFGLQLQRRGIDAVAQPGRAGPILEHISEVAAALRAQHLGPDHAVADVTLLVDMAVDR